jgi:hypothetical protein
LPSLLASIGRQDPAAGRLRRLEHLLPNGWRDFLRQVAGWLGVRSERIFPHPTTGN